MSFYVTLPSNASMDIYPENTMTRYTTKLKTPLQLEGKFQVGLAEIMYPVNWKYRKDEIITSTSINAGKKKDSKFTVHFFANETIFDIIESINAFFSYPAAFVVNTDPSYLPGQHWLVLFFDEKGHCDFFDSFGNHHGYFGFVEYLNTVARGWSYNKQKLQHNLNNTCGNYCIFFILLRCRNFKMKEIVNNFFSKSDLILNDLLISNI